LLFKKRKKQKGAKEAASELASYVVLTKTPPPTLSLSKITQATAKKLVATIPHFGVFSQN
jgi:hypothetical protein